LDMVKLRIDYEVPESYIDEKLKLTMEKLSNKDKEKLVRVFNEEGRVVSFPDKIELSRLKDGPIDYYVEGVEPGEWLEDEKRIEPSKVKFKLTLLDSDGREIANVNADSVKLEITDELIYYRYMTGYDCSPEQSIRNAFGKANVITGLRKGGTIEPDLYPRTREKLFQGIQVRYNWRTPWYIEAGNEPENGWDWTPGGIIPGSPKADSVLAIKLLKAGANSSISLIFVGRIRDDFKIKNWGALLSHAVPHEFGHQFGGLSDKYLTPKDHSTGTCCIMDNFILTTDALGDNVAKNICNSFCPKCIEKLKKGKNKWDKGDK